MPVRGTQLTGPAQVSMLAWGRLHAPTAATAGWSPPLGRHS